MFKRYWIIAVALGLVATLGQAQSASQSAQGATSQQETPAEALPISISAEIVDDDEDAKTRERREKEARQREIDDLAAQQGMNAATQSMNEATQRMATDSRQMTIATWVGVALLVVTLLLTLQANRAAVKAATISLRSERPWLRVNVEPADVLHGSPVSVLMKLNLRIENCGKSPAHIERIYHRIEVQPTPTRLPDFAEYKMNETVFPSERMGDTTLGFEFTYQKCRYATFAVCVHYVDMLTNEKHWVKRRFDCFAGKGGGPFFFDREARLEVEEWGFYDDGEYQVDSK